MRRLLLLASVTGFLAWLALAGQAQAASLDLEGTASLAPSGVCTKANCSGSFTASLAGPPIGVTSETLTLNLVLDPRQANTITGCYPTAGYGGLGNGYSATFVGEICPAYAYFKLSGTVGLNTADLCTSPWQALSGQLSAYGEIQTFGPTPLLFGKPGSKHPPNPIWPVDQAVVSIVGVASQLPAPCPQP